ncbi:MAG: tRNA lysidine(34) synthetase TilS [Firmicutes bacterium]|jgi:tRNA(Ile)-lysidine synthase|nr:tRNA lysidine(34) synthetase TilS [Bacillota bacterium]NBI63746.1 tRNA lysidine(34) synthetase TilS [Clostridiales bacterium]
MVTKKIKKTIYQHQLVQRGDHVIIGLSGGPDSVCLFHVLKHLRQELDIALYAVHVNHRFRPGAAEEDQAYVEALCQESGIACVPFVYDCEAIAKELGVSSEEAGRKARYASFRKVAHSLEQNGVDPKNIKIAVAQNAEDQAETVLLRLLRGSGPDGLAGIAYSRKEEGYQVIRPLLDVRRAEIEAYCQAENLKPRMDHTNSQPIYTRNKIRLQLLPYLRETFNPNINDALIRLSKIAAEDKAYLWQAAEEEYQRLLRPDGQLDLEGVRRLKRPIRRRVMMKALEVAGLSQDITASHLEAADSLIEGKTDSASLDFPKNYAMRIQYGSLRFYKKEADSKRRLPGARLRVQIIELENRDQAYPENAAVFDYDKICQCHETREIHLRGRQAGDYLSLKNGRKKLQDFFVDQKIPKQERDGILLAAIGSEVLWVAATEGGPLKRHRYSEKYKVDQGTKKALTLEILCEI